MTRKLFELDQSRSLNKRLLASWLEHWVDHQKILEFSVTFLGGGVLEIIVV